MTGRCKFADEVGCGCDDYCAYGLGWKGEGRTRELSFCKMHEKDACKKKNSYEVGLQFTYVTGRLISGERERRRDGNKIL